jgi:MinD superfamily P-loop ATPase
MILLCLGGCGKSTAASSEAFIVTTSADKVILDCDMGYVNDDAFALMLLLQADKMDYIELLGAAVYDLMKKLYSERSTP